VVFHVCWFRSPQGSVGPVCSQAVKGSCYAEQETWRLDSCSSAWCVRCNRESSCVFGLTLRVHYGYVVIYCWLSLSLLRSWCCTQVRHFVVKRRLSVTIQCCRNGFTNHRNSFTAW